MYLRCKIQKYESKLLTLSNQRNNCLPCKLNFNIKKTWIDDLTGKKSRAEKLDRFRFANKFDTSLLFENGASAKLGEHNANFFFFFLHEIDGQSGVSILWVHTAQLEFGTKTAALQLSGHHACTSRMWETRKLELGQFKKIILNLHKKVLLLCWK